MKVLTLTVCLVSYQKKEKKIMKFKLYIDFETLDANFTDFEFS